MKSMFESIERTHQQEEIFDRIQAEYDKLCPKPSEFVKSQAVTYEIEIFGNSIFRDSEGALTKASITPVNLRLGVDWRLCRWTIEDAKRIHGEDK